MQIVGSGACLLCVGGRRCGAGLAGTGDAVLLRSVSPVTHLDDLLQPHVTRDRVGTERIEDPAIYLLRKALTDEADVPGKLVERGLLTRHASCRRDT
jgi:hypothetical protein